MLTVILPSAGRSPLLKIALQSVADQTAVKKIDRIIVSENLNDRASESVCKEFPQLPIHYIFRDPPLTPLAHAQALWKEWLGGDLMCVLHDDDWWLPHHIEEGLAALEANPDAAVYGTNLIYYGGDALHLKLIPTDRDPDIFPWFAASYPPPAPYWRISHTNVVLASFFGLLVHYSGMIIRTEAMRHATYIYDLDNEYDNDRMVLYALSQRGPLLYNPKHGICVRFHEQRESHRFTADKLAHDRLMGGTSAWMVESSLKTWQAIATAFVQRIMRCPDEERRAYIIRDATVREWCLPEIARHLDREKEKEFFAMYDRARKVFANSETPQDK